MSKYNFTGSVLFCDDMRHEVGGKTSLIGVYSDTINVEQLPMEHPHFHTVAVITFDSFPEGLDEVEMTIQTPDGEEVSMQMQMPEDNRSIRTLRPVMIGRNLSVEAEGNFVVTVKVDGETRVIGEIPLVVEK